MLKPKMDFITGHWITGDNVTTLMMIFITARIHTTILTDEYGLASYLHDFHAPVPKDLTCSNFGKLGRNSENR